MSQRGFAGTLPFLPDRFQVEAFEAIERGMSVVVSAPTGAGKTLVAEAAIARALGRGRRTFYTTPIKALSNQKYGDLVEEHGEEAVGLLTGDNSINGDARIVVMTTEVLRNMIYIDPRALDEVDTVILDEVHYLQDPVRGPVWEEIIIHAPDQVALVCLSATVSNAHEFADWVRERRGATHLVVEDNRPVPLESLYLIKDLWNEDPLRGFPVFVSGRPNREIENLLRQRKGRRRRFVTPRRFDVVDYLRARGMLPAIYFIFSRAGCDSAAATVASSGLRLTQPQERAQLREICERRTAHLPVEDLQALRFDHWLAQVETGVAAHHAGMVPAFKEAVEEGFAAGLIKVVFATETLALGINMPARTVVLESMTKFNGESHELLQPGQYTQLTGRAGRRGIDDQGFGMTLYSPFVPFDRVSAIAGSGSHPLSSSFRPTYNMVANLMANYDRSEAHELLEASFARYQRQSAARFEQAAIVRLSEEAASARARAACDQGDVFAFLEDIDSVRAQPGRGVLDLESGDVIEPGGSSNQRYIVVQRDRWRSADPRIIVVNVLGKVRRLRLRNLEPGSLRLGRVDLPRPFKPKDGRYLQRAGKLLNDFRPQTEQLLGWTVTERSSGHPVAQCPDVADHVRLAQKTLRLEREIKRRSLRADGSTSDLLDELESIVELMDERGYSANWELTESGGQLRMVYNELDLLLVESIRSGAFAGSSPAELASLASTFVYDPRGVEELGRMPSPESEDGWEIVMGRWRSLVDDEQRHRLRPSRRPEPGYAAVVYWWAMGATLEEILEDEEVTAGDFVRNLRQVLDLLRQLRDGFPDIRENARRAIALIDRGVVAAGGQE